MVEQQLIEWLTSDSGQVVHLGVFILLILGGLGFPIPEDIPILLAGVAASKGIVTLPSIFLTTYAGVIIADQIVYFFGYFFGQKMLSAGTRSKFFPSITDEKVQELREGLRKRRLIYIFIGRHLFPVRSLTFITAGSLRIPYLEFFLADALAALISVTLVMAFGYYLGEQLTPEVAQHLARKAHVYILLLVLLTIIGFLIRIVLRKRRQERANLTIVEE